MATYNVAGDLPTGGGLRQYSTFRNHAYGTVLLRVGSYEGGSIYARGDTATYNKAGVTLRFGLYQAGQAQTGPTLTFTNSELNASKSFGLIGAGNYALQGRCQGWGGGTVPTCWWDGVLTI